MYVNILRLVDGAPWINRMTGTKRCATNIETVVTIVTRTRTLAGLTGVNT